MSCRIMGRLTRDQALVNSRVHTWCLRKISVVTGGTSTVLEGRKSGAHGSFSVQTPLDCNNEKDSVRWAVEFF
jgi:hypothetical protein